MLRSHIDIDLLIGQLRDRGNPLKIGESDYKLSDHDIHKNEIIEKLKSIRCNDLEDMVYRMELTYDGNIDILDKKYIGASTTGYTLPRGIYEISDLNLMLKSLLPDDVEVNITNDDISLRSNLTTYKTIKFTKRSFYTILGFTQSHSGPLGDIKGLVQKIPETYKIKKLIYITGIEKIPCLQSEYEGLNNTVDVEFLTILA